MIEELTLATSNRKIRLMVSTDHIEADIRMSQVYRVIQDEHSSCDALSCSARGGFSVYDRVKRRDIHTPERFAEHVRQQCSRQECAILKEYNPPLIVSPPYDAFEQFGRQEANALMTDVLTACDGIKAKKLRMTQFGFLQTDKNEPEFEGVLDAIEEYLELESSSVQTIFFDIDPRRKDSFLRLVRERAMGSVD